MRLQVVCDASTVVALLVDSGTDGRWATDALRGADLAAPQLLPFEAASIIRRHELAALITADQAAQAHADLLDLTVEQWPYDLLAPRAWQLRSNLTTYDASYVALAELLDVTLVTLDRRLGRAPACAARSARRRTIRRSGIVRLAGETAVEASGQTRLARMAGDDVTQKPARSYIPRPPAVASSSARRMPRSRAQTMTESKAILP